MKPVQQQHVYIQVHQSQSSTNTSCLYVRSEMEISSQPLSNFALPAAWTSHTQPGSKSLRWFNPAAMATEITPHNFKIEVIYTEKINFAVPPTEFMMHKQKKVTSRQGTHAHTHTQLRISPDKDSATPTVKGT